MKPFSTLAFVPLALVLAACSTPDVALQQANHTSALMASMERELNHFRRVTKAAEESQRASLHEQRQALGTADLLAGPRIRSRISAGDSATQALVDRIIADTEALAADEAKAAGALAANDAEVARIMTPLPSTDAAVTKAQTKLAVMGVELSKGTRIGELRSFAEDIKENVDANRKKIKEAQAAAAAKR
jgi:hypothetical protein